MTNAFGHSTLFKFGTPLESSSVIPFALLEDSERLETTAEGRIATFVLDGSKGGPDSKGVDGAGGTSSEVNIWCGNNSGSNALKLLPSFYL